MKNLILLFAIVTLMSSCSSNPIERPYKKDRLEEDAIALKEILSKEDFDIFTNYITSKSLNEGQMLGKTYGDLVTEAKQAYADMKVKEEEAKILEEKRKKEEAEKRKKEEERKAIEEKKELEKNKGKQELLSFLQGKKFVKYQTIQVGYNAQIRKTVVLIDGKMKYYVDDIWMNEGRGIETLKCFGYPVLGNVVLIDVDRGNNRVKYSFEWYKGV